MRFLFLAIILASCGLTSPSKTKDIIGPVPTSYTIGQALTVTPLLLAEIKNTSIGFKLCAFISTLGKAAPSPSSDGTQGHPIGLYLTAQANCKLTGESIRKDSVVLVDSFLVMDSAANFYGRLSIYGTPVGSFVNSPSEKTFQVVELCTKQYFSICSLDVTGPLPIIRLYTVGQGPTNLTKTVSNLCPDGSYSSGSCNLCPDGSYHDSCGLCPNNQYGCDGGSDTKLCPDGSYHDSCGLCPDNKYGC